MDEKKQQILQLIKRNVQEIDPSAEVILYGSRARGDEHAESDWDTKMKITPFYRNVSAEGIRL